MKDENVLKENVTIRSEWKSDHYELSVDALEILEAKVADQGRYFCRIDYEKAMKNSSDVSLKVGSKFSFICNMII